MSEPARVLPEETTLSDLMALTKDAAAAARCVGDARRSNRVIVRSVDTASALCPSGVSARSRKGFSAALYKNRNKS